MQTKQFSQIVSCTTKIHKDFVSTKFQQLYFFANHVASTRSHASLRSRAPVGFLPHPPSPCLGFNFPYAHTCFYSLFLSRSIICSLFLFSSFLNRKLFVFVFSIFFLLVGVLFPSFLYSYPYLIGFGDQIRSHKQATAFCETQDFTITHFVMIFFYIYKIYL